ncbi:hypothetical protein FB480_101162 [Agrobacterium vitis]|nr:hypothetical protein FB480_101162 [Agrobacterium vitis]
MKRPGSRQPGMSRRKAQDLGGGAVVHGCKAPCQPYRPLRVKNLVCGSERIAKHIGNVIGRITQQSLWVDGDPAAAFTTNDIIMMKIAMERFDHFLLREQGAGESCAPTDHVGNGSVGA